VTTSSTARQRPAGLTRLIVAVSLAGFAVIGYSAALLPSTPHPIAWLVVGALALVAGSFALKVPGVSANLSISDTFFITSALLFGPAPATITIAIDSLVISWNRRPTLDRLLFNLTSNALSLWMATQVFFALAGTTPLFDRTTPPGAEVILPLACLALVYYVLNSGLLATALALDKGVPAIEIWRRHFTVISLNYFASASAAFVLVILLKYVSPIAVAALAPVLVIFYLAMRSWLGRLEDADKHVEKVNRLYLSTVSALSTAIEAKDGITSDHIHRVQGYAMGLARALEVTDATTLQAIEAAALLHDTGKIAIPEHILNKPGRLTPVEFETMKSHVDVGAEILSSIDFPYPVVPIVEAHHENWDGSGYPRGLRGETIPIGARILAVVDCFDALTSDRPYRPALGEEDAIAIVMERRGTFYDPAVVDTFVRVYRDIAPSAAPQPQLQSALQRIRRVRAAADVTAPAPPGPHVAPATDSSEELLAFVSLARLASQTPTVGDIGALAWSHLRHLLPGATLAIFTLDSRRNAVIASCSFGSAASSITGTMIGIGQRVTGWVAANARAMLNAAAELDLATDTPPDIRFVVAVPLVADGAVVGVMSVYARDAFSEDRSRSLEMIAPHLATAVASARAAANDVRAAAFAEQGRPRPTGTELHVVARR
jgi:putative nucleotidyltransferase with HDIG domain